METVIYKAVPGCEIRADVYPVVSRAPCPVLVLIHGGALIGGNRKGIRPVLRDICARDGIAQVSIDYRLAPETKLPAIVEDVKDAFRWVRGEGARRYNFDPARVGVLGWSAGGYLSLLAGCRVEPRPRVVVAFYGYGDIAASWYAEPDPFYCQQPAVSREEALASVGSDPVSDPPPGKDRFRFYLYCRQQGLWPKEVAGFDPHTQQTEFDTYCPVRNVSAVYPPALLFHGTADTDVPYQQSVDMAGAFAESGVPHELVTIDGGGHGFDGGVKFADLQAVRPSPGAKAFDRTLSYLKQYL